MMSQQFRAMNMAMSTVIDSFQTLQDTSGHAIDVSALNAAQRELQQVESNFNQFEQEIRQADDAQRRLNKDIDLGSKITKRLVSGVMALTGTYLGLQAVVNTIKLSDELTNTTARLNMVNDGLQTTAEMQEMIFQSAQKSFAPYNEMADLVAKLGLNAPEAFGSNAEALAFAELLNKQFAIAGTSAEGVSAATQQLIQALGSGVLRGEELNSIFEQAPNIIRSIADYLEVPIGQIREMAAEGQITASIVKASMFDAAEDINKQFESMPKTFANIWTEFQNDALKAFEPVLQQISEIANSSEFQNFVDGVTNVMFILADIVSFAIDAISTFGSFMYDNWSILGPIILGVAGALLTYTTYLGIARVATMALTAAQWALDVAMSANPIGLIIAGLVLLIALFYAAIGAINQFTGTSLSATGIIVGAFMTAGAFIGNIFFTLINFVIDIFVVLWNFIAAFANFFANVFTDPIGAIARLFFDLVDTVLSLLQTLASAIDTIFGSNLAGSVQGWRDGLDGWVDDTFGKGTEVMAEVKSEDWHLGRFEYGEAWDFGYNLGAGFEDSITNFDLNNMLGSYGNNDFGSIPQNLEDIATNTGAMKDSIDISTEDLKYLRDLAEREAVNRYTTAEISIEMNNENHISSEADVDGIFDRFAEAAEETADMMAEGGGTDV
ncbi:membrane protein [Lysinibacillus sp. PLM2]|nr:membrane protein [Lysinibacillus sp. PLM2]